MRLSQLLKDTGNSIFRGPATGDPVITSLVYDSRKCQEGSLFFATDGIHTDGHLYIDQAIRSGAIAVVISRELKDYAPEISYIKVESPRRALSPFAASFYGYPARSLKVIGVTGTDGKSSTVALIHQLLELSGKRAGYLSTVAYKAGEQVIANPYRQSTPEAVELQAILAQMRDSGSEYAVIEATSHGLSPKNNRLGDVEFTATVFTNVTHEHLEFHGSVEQYRKDKTELFSLLKPGLKGGFGVVNADDDHHRQFIDATGSPVYRYGIKNPKSDYKIKKLTPANPGFDFLIETETSAFPANIQLNGEFNVENATAAFITVSGLLQGDPDSPSANEIAQLLHELTPIKGRMNLINPGEAYRVIVDYAHTPGSFEKLLPSMSRETVGRLIVVFGSAGERDTEKRAVQGAIADKYADLIILTDEDPRLEDSMQIIDQIANGCPEATGRKDLYKIPDRRKAIYKAVALARPGDTVLLLGKGHESSIIYGNTRKDWDEQSVATEAIRSLQE